MSRADVVGVPVSRIQRMRQRPLNLAAVLVDTSGTLVITATASATLHTVGAWVELIAATTADTDRLVVGCSTTAAANADTRTLVDIGVGAVGVETVIIGALPAGFVNNMSTITGNNNEYTIPVRIPKGTRIAARCQSLITVKTVGITAATALVGGAGVGSVVDTYGADLAGSQGTNMPTTDAYVTLTAATTQPYQALIMIPCGGASNSFASETSVYTLAIGAAGAEVPLTTTTVNTNASEYIKDFYPWSAMVTRNIPAGTRIACKQSVGRAYRDVIVFGVRY